VAYVSLRLAPSTPAIVRAFIDLATEQRFGEAILKDVTRHIAGAEPGDDMTMLVLRWH
jgi:serine phosphatase RsbU (regulator of sigma subunit)